MIGFDEAVALVRKAARPLGTETVAIGQAHRRVLAEPVAAAVDSPPCDVSAMDGYAVRDADLEALPARLEVVGASYPGCFPPDAVGAQRCVRIFTGAPVPEGADRIVIQEEVVREGPQALFAAPPGSARHIRRRGGDFSVGERLIAAGRRLDARAVVAAAGADLDRVEVFRRPRILVIGTGDELAPPGEARSRPGAIPESVSFGVAALAADWDGECVARIHVPDDLARLERAAAESVDACDLVVVTGGASVGERDFARRMFEPLGLSPIFSKVAIKPGKPVWLGTAGGRLILGLPGNPTSAMVTARLFMAPLLAGLGGLDPDTALRFRRARLAEPIPACGSRETFHRAQAQGGEARLVSNPDSSAQKALAAADLLVRRRADSPALPRGETVEVLDF